MSRRKLAKKQALEREGFLRLLLEDENLQSDLKSAVVASRNIYEKISGKDAKSLVEALHAASPNGEQIAEVVSKVSRSRGIIGKVVLLGALGSAAAVVTVVAVPPVRSALLDLIFGPEEELDYSAGPQSSSD